MQDDAGWQRSRLRVCARVPDHCPARLPWGGPCVHIPDHDHCAVHTCPSTLECLTPTIHKAIKPCSRSRLSLRTPSFCACRCPPSAVILRPRTLLTAEQSRLRTRYGKGRNGLEYESVQRSLIRLNRLRWFTMTDHKRSIKSSAAMAGTKASLFHSLRQFFGFRRARSASLHPLALVTAHQPPQLSPSQKLTIDARSDYGRPRQVQ